jgi:uncharacterized protein YbjT (DUF2867 family)
MILVTGATGSIGSLVVKRLLARGQRPRVFVRDEAKARERFGDRVDYAIGDLGDTTTLASALRGIARVLLLNTGPELSARDTLAADVARSVGVAHIVHSHDIADVSVAALIGREHDGATLTITGPTALSYGEMVAILANALGCALAFSAISEAEERARWTSRGETKASVDYHLSIFRTILEGRLADVTDTVRSVLRRPATTFQEWAHENAAAFR